MAANDHAMGDTMYANSLKHLLKPELHGIIQPWLRQARPIDKRGVMHLDRLAQPQLIARMGRPADTQKASASQRPGLQAAGLNMLSSCNSAPALVGQPPGYETMLPPPPESSEIETMMEEIQKPGNAMVHVHDSMMMMKLKIKHRNRVGCINSLG
jgi:hypothetical protein